MKKYCCLYIIFFVLTISITKAQQQVSLQEIQSIAINVLDEMNIQKNSQDVSIDTIYTFKDSMNRVLLYEVVFQNYQAILFSGSKACLPILGQYKIAQNQSILSSKVLLPDGLSDILENYIVEIKNCMNNDTITLFHAEEWNILQQKNIPNRITTSIVVAPLLTSRWSQNYPYNFYTPGNNQYTHCPVGCVAVAMAQVMNYWKYPVWNIYNGVNQFDWCYMVDDLTSLSAIQDYEKKRAAVAGLLYECGLSVNMDYCSGGENASSAVTKDIRDALVDIYGYSSDADYQLRSSYNNNTWIGRIKNNLNHSWPVIYKGRSSLVGGEGHAFVCDGYDSDDRFHFNFGWGGAWDGYFTLNNLTPNSDNYNYLQAAIFNIYPSGTQNYCNFDLPLWVHYYMYYLIYGNTTPEPYQNVPKTFTKLTSVPSSLSQYPSSWRTIPSGATAEYAAHEEILLEDGFEAQQGSVFDAYIIPCYACETNRENTIVSNQIEERAEDNTNLQRKVVESFILEEMQADKPMYIYPNPTDGTFYIKLENVDESIKQVYVNNILGKEMLRKNNLHSNEAIDISTLSAGLYVVRVFTNRGKTYYGKLVKE